MPVSGPLRFLIEISVEVRVGSFVSICLVIVGRKVRIYLSRGIGDGIRYGEG